MKSKFVFCLYLFLIQSACLFAQSCFPQYLRCEYKVNPLGIDQAAPRLSWIITSPQNGLKQTAYQVIVASSREKLDANIGDLWDTGKVNSDETSCVVYEGKPLRSQMLCFWKVRVWDKDGIDCGWSAPASWSMGLLNKSDWKAQWIGFDSRPQNVYENHNDKQPYTFADCNWICLPKGKYLFQKTVRIDPLTKPKNLRLHLAVDGKATVYVNNEKFADFQGLVPVRNLNLIDKLIDGNNIITIQVESLPDSPNSPALIGKIIFEYISSPSATFPIDSVWNDNAKKMIPYGSAPWGRFDKTRLILPPPAYLRNDFEITKPVKRATIYASALGLYQLNLNGKTVGPASPMTASRGGQDYFTPGWTDYNIRVYYNTYDVTQMLHQGNNAIGAILADGWFAGYIGWSLDRHHYGQNTRLLAQLCVEYDDGTSQVFATGPEWKASTGPIQLADIIMGETYDARKEIKSDSWQKVNITKSISAVLQSYPGETVRQFAEIKPVSLKQPLKDVFVYDMGTNFAGVVRLKVKANPGDTITLRFAERLNPDGTIYTENLRDARATDIYICKGNETEIWQPQFTYHGFQYVEVTGFLGKPDMDTITGIELTSASPPAGSFQCSDKVANQLYHNICQTQRANFMDIPTDCPQRNERMGWTGDAQVYVGAACMNSDVQTFFEKWLTDLRDSQAPDGQFPKVAPSKLAGPDGGPAWSDAGVICPWTIYSVYGDKRLLEQSYPSMKRFISFCKNRSTKDFLPPKKYHCFGDWLNINDDTPKDVIYTAYFAYSTKLTARAAAALGKNSDAKEYEELFQKIKDSFNNAYVEPNGSVLGNSQTAYVLALAFDLLDEPVRTKAAARLIERIKQCDWHLSTGFVGTKDLMLALAKIGRNDVAFRLFQNDTFPSWGFSIKNGATSIWERWDGWTPDKGFQIARMNSFSHYAFGAVGQWMFENIGGIKSDGPGFKKIIINSQPGGNLSWAKTSYNSIHGLIVSNWKIEQDIFKLNVSIPANTTATVYIPAENDKDVMLADNFRNVKFLKKQGRYILYEIPSGNYQFTAHCQH
ncbi:MAG: family 78 glycoside hydrolase catalytic domain [Sedimentisphaerales bacterium]